MVNLCWSTKNKIICCSLFGYFPFILVGGIPTPLKNMSPSVGMMTFPIYGKIIQMFQTTNQALIFHYQRVNHHWITIKSPLNHHQINVPFINCQKNLGWSTYRQAWIMNSWWIRAEKRGAIVELELVQPRRTIFWYTFVSPFWYTLNPYKNHIE